MSSTRNKNTPGDYEREQWAQSQLRQVHSNREGPSTVHHPGHGLIGHTCPGSELSFNAPDVESFLFGINSTNLVAPRIVPTMPDLKPLATLDMASRPRPVQYPQPLFIEPNQRPTFH